MIIILFQPLPIFINNPSHICPSCPHINIYFVFSWWLTYDMIPLCFLQVICHSKFSSHEVCIYLRLLHQVLQSLFLQECFLLLLHLLLHFLVNLFSFPLGVSLLLISFPPVVAHFLCQFPCPHYWFLRESLCFYCSFSDFFKTILR